MGLLLCQPARWLEVCQHARGSSRCSSRCPESPDVEPLCQMVAVPVHKTVLMVRFFACLWWYCLFYSLMWRPIGCVCHHFIVKSMYSLFYSLSRLKFVVEDTVYILCWFSNCTFIYHIAPDKQNRFNILYQFCLAF